MKKGLLIGVIILVLVVLGVLSYNFYQNTIKTSVGAGPCSEDFYEAQNELDVSICESVIEISPGKNPYYDNACRDQCIQEVAYEKGDSGLCNLINDFKDIPPVEGWGDPRETGSYKDFCYIHLAEKLGDDSLCDNVETDWAVENCPL